MVKQAELCKGSTKAGIQTNHDKEKEGLREELNKCKRMIGKLEEENKRLRADLNARDDEIERQAGSIRVLQKSKTKKRKTKR